MTKVITESSLFDNFILVVITVSSVAMAVENPLNRHDGWIHFMLMGLDYVTTVVFVFEVVVKIITWGFLLNGPKSFIRDTWNVVDFFIVVVAIVSLFPMPVNLTFLKVIRMGRLLRPLRVISKNENLKLSL
jgi:hypothetical protein